MAVMTKEYIIGKLKDILPIELTETTEYNNQLGILVGGSISKLVSEGLDIDAKDKNGNYIFQQDTNIGDDYIICVGYQVMKDLDYDVDMDFMTEQYITRIGTLRCRISVLQH